MRHFDRLEGNHDGTISLEEFHAMGVRRFLRFDLDGDGRVTREEMAEAKREHHKRKADLARPGFRLGRGASDAIAGAAMCRRVRAARHGLSRHGGPC